MMNGRNNQQIIDDIFIRCSEKLDKQMYMFENILGERDMLSLVEDSLYYYVAGNILMLKPTEEDTSTNPELLVSGNEEYYKDERDIILKYLLTIIHFEVGDNHEEALEDCVKMLETTTRTFNREFLNVVYLLILFDGDELYRNLRKPLADYCASIIYNEFKLRGELA